eukprot:m.153817 g.153817  ORF g.153817 m.153817 type:complete len:427 (-) comp17482_c0_seq1:15-1295(-)
MSGLWVHWVAFFVVVVQVPCRACDGHGDATNDSSNSDRTHFRRRPLFRVGSLASPELPARRLVIRGASVIDPQTNETVLLEGVNWYMSYFHGSDGALLAQALPRANVVRLVGVLWDNSLDTKTDCLAPDAKDAGYLKPECLQRLETAVRAAQRYGVWVIITDRSEYGAGEDYPLHPDVFHNATLRNQMMTMWRFVAGHFATWDGIAAYEIMSEPRSKIVPQAQVAALMQQGCAAVHTNDTAPCVVGPAPYYKLWQYNATMLLVNDTNVVYTFDFFLPKLFVTASSPSTTYPTTLPCDSVYPGWTQVFCPHDTKSPVIVNRDWMTTLLANYVLSFRAKFDVPVYCNQWGVHHEVSVTHGRLRYAVDLVSVLRSNAIHHTYWIWRSYKKQSWGYELVHPFDNGTQALDTNMLAVLNGTPSAERVKTQE